METSNGMNKTWLIIIAVVAVLTAMGVAQFSFPRTAVSPSPEVSEPAPVESTTTPSLDIKEVTVNSSPHVAPALPSIAKGDNIASWNFKGVYTDNPELVTKAKEEIKRLSDLIGKGTYTDMALYVGIANQYELLGEGSPEYDYLGRAIEAGGTASGLPWHNLGVLMERLGALETARVAYEKATLIQPEMKFYHYAYFEFLTTRMKEDAVRIEKEYAAALSNLGQDSDVLSLYSEWKQS